jgi:hypothetical protein
MRVFIANFGEGNYEWPVCKERSTIATMNEFSAHRLWEAGDRETFVAQALTKKTRAGHTPTRPVASRWFNLMSIIVTSADDLYFTVLRMNSGGQHRRAPRQPSRRR